MTGRGPLVPYVACWSGEKTRIPQIVARRHGIGFADERPGDRDIHGVLWQRDRFHQGRGRPEFGRMHSVRQRLAMLQLLCQVCGGPADQTEDGVLWLLFDDRAEFPDIPDWPNSLTTSNPPVCLPCARIAVRVCPALRRLDHCALRVARSTVAGVYGARYRPGHPRPIPIGGMTVAFDNPVIRWTIAAQLVRELNQCTVIDLPAG